MTDALLHIAETAARAAFAVTRSQRASEWISEVRMARRFRAFSRAHLARGGEVVTRQRGGMTVVSLEG